MRVVYSGAVVSNGGDAAIMEAQAALVGEAVGEQVQVLHDNTPAVAQRLFPDAEVLPPTHQVVHRPAGSSLRVRVLRRANEVRVQAAASAWRVTRGASMALLSRGERRQMRSLARAGLVAYCGGTSLIERYSVQGKTYELDIAARLGRPVVLLPASLGPFHQPRNQRLVRRVVAQARLTLLRDERSLRHLREIGADTRRAHVVPDVVFALATDAGLDRLRHASLPQRPRVAVSVRDIKPFAEVGAAQEQEGYERAVAGLVTKLVREQGASVIFTSTCQGVPEYWTDDSRVADSVVERLPDDVRGDVVVDHEAHGVAGTAAAFAQADLAVCTRMHAAILALGVGTPVLPISYEFKIDEVMAQLGLGDVVTPVRGATSEALLDAYARLTDDLPTRCDEVATRLSAARADLQRVPDLLREALRQTA